MGTVVIGGVISRVTIIITHIRGQKKTLLITTHEPPSMGEIFLRMVQ